MRRIFRSFKPAAMGKKIGGRRQGYKEESIRDESVKFERNGAKKAELSDSEVWRMYTAADSDGFRSQERRERQFSDRLFFETRVWVNHIDDALLFYELLVKYNHIVAILHIVVNWIVKINGSEKNAK